MNTISHGPLPGAVLSAEADDARGAESQEKTQWLNTPFINRSAVRRFLLERAESRAHKFERVSEDTLRQINELVRSWCINHVARFPSKGKTL